MRMLAAAAFTVLAIASPGRAQIVRVDVPPEITVLPLPAGSTPRPVSLTRLAANIPPGTPWADDAMTSGPIALPCSLDSGAQVSRWTEANNRFETIDTFERVVRQELGAAGFRTGGDPNNLFEESQSSDLQLGALITDLKVRTCQQETVTSTLFGGSAVMSIEWQIFSVSEGRVIGRVSTRGGTVLKQSKTGSGLALITGAFGDNVRRLAADDAFRKIVLTSAGPTLPAPKASALSFRATTDKATPLSVAVSSVVTIHAGDSMGSGVLISPDGYVLTNHHVAGSTGPVRIRWSDGAETVGEVIRGDRRRDVALIKVTPKARPLAIRATPVQLGETVFAVGTPLRKEFSNTLTRGVVSGTRLLEGLPMIQSDVAVDRGNSGGPLLDEQGRIVALAVSGYEEGGVGRNINFFIPIADALQALSLKPDG